MRLYLPFLLLAGLGVTALGHRATGNLLAEKSSPGAGGFGALMDEYKKALAESDAIFHKAKSDDERQQARADFQKWRALFLDRVLAFAEAHPVDSDTLVALFFTLHPDTHAEDRQVAKAVDLILKDHATSDRLTDPPILQMVEDSPAAERLMRGVLKNNPYRPAQAQACLQLGRIIKRKAGSAPPAEAARLTAEAEALFQRAADNYADVKKAAERAKAELFEMRHLAVGKTLPDITGTDSDSRELKLSDFRGKVVVLSFWADWCLPCMKMVPHERSLVKRLTGKPFALIGVNRNETLDGLKKCEREHGITWRSFFDGPEGPISTGHNIQRMPTIYVLDGKGVIRYMGVRGEELDKVVDLLLAEMDERTKK